MFCDAWGPLIQGGSFDVVESMLMIYEDRGL